MRSVRRRVVVAGLLVSAVVSACGSSAPPSSDNGLPMPAATSPVMLTGTEATNVSILGRAHIVSVDATTCHLEWNTVHPLGPTHPLTLIMSRPVTVTTFRPVQLTLTRTVVASPECDFTEVAPAVPG